MGAVLAHLVITISALGPVPSPHIACSIRDISLERSTQHGNAVPAFSLTLKHSEPASNGCGAIADLTGSGSGFYGSGVRQQNLFLLRVKQNREMTWTLQLLLQTL